MILSQELCEYEHFFCGHAWRAKYCIGLKPKFESTSEGTLVLFQLCSDPISKYGKGTFQLSSMCCRPLKSPITVSCMRRCLLHAAVNPIQNLTYLTKLCVRQSLDSKGVSRLRHQDYIALGPLEQACWCRQCASVSQILEFAKHQGCSLFSLQSLGPTATKVNPTSYQKADHKSRARCGICRARLRVLTWQQLIALRSPLP